MITNFLIGAIAVAAGWALLAFGRNWFDTMIRRVEIGRRTVWKAAIMTGRKSDVWDWALFGWPATIALAGYLIWWVLK